MKDSLEPGTEYHESLSRFLIAELSKNHISVMGIRRIYIIRSIAWVLLLASTIIKAHACVGFIIHGGFLSLFTLSAAGFVFATSVLTLSCVPGDMFYKLAAIGEDFTEESLYRLVVSGAPEDVISDLFRAMRYTKVMKYSDVYDTFWLCSRKAAGIDTAVLLQERYQQISWRIAVSQRKIL